MSRYRLAARAEGDLDDIWFHVAGDSVDAADRVVALVIQRFPVLAQMRKMGRPREKLASGLRSLPVGDYVIFYRLIPNGVEILRVLHGSRDIPSLIKSLYTEDDDWKLRPNPRFLEKVDESK